jgi:hypothetical protein
MLFRGQDTSSASDSSSDRQAPDAKARFFNDNNCSVLQCRQGFLQNDAQSVDYVRSASVLYRHAHVGKKPHSLPYDDFLLDKPGYVFKRLLEVTGFQIRIIRKNFLLCRTVRDLTDDHRHG